VREQVGAETIRELEESFVESALATWRRNPNILLLGNPDLPRVSIVSFGIRYPLEAKPVGMLHPNFVVAVLGDLFGIQARSGCFCAGPYVHRLVDFDAETSAAHEAEFLRGHEGIKLGFVRVTFEYFLSEAVFAYLVEAVDFLAEHAWKLLPLYSFDPRTGLWRHRHAPSERPATLSLGSALVSHPATAPESALAGHLDEARRIVSELEARPSAPVPPTPFASEEFERLRWFPLPETV
jgi:hypothetical protein